MLGRVRVCVRVRVRVPVRACTLGCVYVRVRVSCRACVCRCAGLHILGLLVLLSHSLSLTLSVHLFNV